jgi:hypothetical protein
MEKASMEHEMRRQPELSDSSALDPSEHAATRAAIAFRTLSDDSRSLELINRYESRYDRQYLRAHRRFLEVRDRRTPPSAQTPQPALLPVCPPPVPAVTPQAVPEQVEISKGTRQVAANTHPTRGAGWHPARGWQPRRPAARARRIHVQNPYPRNSNLPMKSRPVGAS